MGYTEITPHHPHPKQLLVSFKFFKTGIWKNNGVKFSKTIWNIWQLNKSVNISRCKSYFSFIFDECVEKAWQRNFFSGNSNLQLKSPSQKDQVVKFCCLNRRVLHIFHFTFSSLSATFQYRRIILVWWHAAEWWNSQFWEVILILQKRPNWLVFKYLAISLISCAYWNADQKKTHLLSYTKEFNCVQDVTLSHLH